ncbi:glycoside hydrolase family 5 protein [Cohnella sp. 56]|uniref:glycoside hydrolase family 5 protein n=1 Tax=Cohnella sp. 56 TaxID=3113722 RepID=UPI0030E85E2A
MRRKGWIACLAAALLLAVTLGSIPIQRVDAAAPAGTAVALNGQLSVSGAHLQNQYGQNVQLKGMSSHGLQWFGGFVNYDSMKWLRDQWGLSVFRLAMYTEESGYLSNPSGMKAKVNEAVQAAIDLGVYVIIDWHILSDNDPNTHKAEAKAFFQEMAARWGSYPNVVYEICNEPNGANVTWSGSIKPYANEVIPVIRAADPDAIVIVGTPTWSQDVNLAADDPLAFGNIMYTAHFYAGSHGQWLRDRIDYAMGKGIAVFVTEWGTSDASGSGGPYLTEAKAWTDYMASRQISWANWSLCDKNEASAALVAGAGTSGGWSQAQLTASGQFVRSEMLGPVQTLFDFEGGSVQGWTGLNVSGGPWSLTEWSAAGAYSLKADVALGGTQSYLMNNTVQNFSGRTKLTAQVKHAPWGNMGMGMSAKLYIKVGSSYAWYDGGAVAINAGGATTLTLNLAGIPNLGDVREIGVQFLPPANSSGGSAVYVDGVTIQ